MKKLIEHVEDKKPTIKEESKRYSCVFTDGVRCHTSDRQCWKCGHNPVVAKARIETFCKKNGITIPGQDE